MFCAQMTVACWYEKESVDSYLRSGLYPCSRSKASVTLMTKSQSFVPKIRVLLVLLAKRIHSSKDLKFMINHTTTRNQGKGECYLSK